VTELEEEMRDEPKWEDVASPHKGDYLERIAVPGGWLYRSYFTDEGNQRTHAIAMCFVPGPVEAPLPRRSVRSIGL
jgi:hypothetical protein